MLAGESPRALRLHGQVIRPRSLVLAALAVSALLYGTACVSSDDIEGIHRHINDVEKEVQAVERKSSSKEEVAKLNTSVSQQTQQLLKSNADTGVKLNEMTAKMEQLEAKLEDTNRRLSQLSQQIAETQGDLARMRSGSASGASPTSPGMPPVPAVDSAVVRPTGGQPSPSDLFDTAYSDYTKGRYALAVQGFQDYLKSYPGTDVADDAQYWIGESHYAQKDYKSAVADFDRLLKEWPRSNKAAAGLLKKAYALLELGQKAEAVVQLQYVIHEYSSSEEARLARARLKSLGIEAK